MEVCALLSAILVLEMPFCRVFLCAVILSCVSIGERVGGRSVVNEMPVVSATAGIVVSVVCPQTKPLQSALQMRQGRNGVTETEDLLSSYT